MAVCPVMIEYLTQKFNATLGCKRKHSAQPTDHYRCCKCTWQLCHCLRLPLYRHAKLCSFLLFDENLTCVDIESYCHLYHQALISSNHCSKMNRLKTINTKQRNSNLAGLFFYPAEGNKTACYMILVTWLIPVLHIPHVFYRLTSYYYVNDPRNRIKALPCQFIFDFRRWALWFIFINHINEQNGMALW